MTLEDRLAIRELVENWAVWRDAGVNTVRLYPAGDTLDAKLSTLGRAIELVRQAG